MAFAFMAFMAFFMGFAAGAGAAAAAFAFIAFIALAMASRGDGYQHEERNPRLEPKWQPMQLVSTACNSKPSKSVSTQSQCMALRLNQMVPHVVWWKFTKSVVKIVSS